MRWGVVFGLICVGCKQKGAAPTIPPVPLPSIVTSTAPIHVDLPPMMALAGTLGADDVRLFIDARDGKAEAVLLDVSHEVSTRLSGTVDPLGHFRFPGLEATAGKDGSLDGSWDEPKRGTLAVHLAVMRSAPEPPGTHAYAGTLGQSTRIRAKLARDGKKLSGIYRYVHSKEDIALEGTIDEQTGKFDLDEPAGHWSGYALSPSFFAGEWASKDGTRHYVVRLQANDSYPEIVSLSKGLKLIPQEDYKEPAPNCTSTRIWPELPGFKLKPLFSDADIDCKGATADAPYYSETSYALTAKHPNAVGLAITHVAFTGGAHESRSFSCVVLDLDKKRIVKLVPDDLDALSKLVTTSLQKENGVTDLRQAGFFDASVKVTVDTSLCLTDSGVDVSFNPYEVAPWSMGAPVVHVGSKEIKPLLPPDTAALMP